MKQISKDWRACSNKEKYIRLSKNAKDSYEREKDQTKLYHRPHGVKKPPNAFILYMRKRMSEMLDEQIKDFHPKELKPRKRDKKDKQKDAESEIGISNNLI